MISLSCATTWSGGTTWFSKIGRRLYSNAEASKFVGDEDANKLLTPTYRVPWVLPKV